jgi:hypothetical protein
MLPEKTGAENGLYSLEYYEGHHKQIVETAFFGDVIDSPCSDILRKLVRGELGKLTLEEKVKWAFFLISLRMRSPEYLQKHKQEANETLERYLKATPEDYLAFKKPDWEDNLNDLVKNRFPHMTGVNVLLKNVLPRAIVDPEKAEHLLDMHWLVFEFSHAHARRLVTSDRPIYYSQGLLHENCLIMLPLSPRHVFFATKNERIVSSLKNSNHHKLIGHCNESIVSQADRFIYGKINRNFIENWMRKRK